MGDLKDNGGKREGAGRKSKAEENHVNTIFLTALKELYKKDKDDDAKVEFVKELLDSQRGQIFVAEHIFGKAKEIVENHNYNQELTKGEAKILKEALEQKY
jgi:hypothetical protein